MEENKLRDRVTNFVAAALVCAVTLVVVGAVLALGWRLVSWIGGW